MTRLHGTSKHPPQHLCLWRTPRQHCTRASCCTADPARLTCTPALCVCCLAAVLPAGNGNAQPLRDDEAGSSKQYAQKATAYGVTLLLIWFTFAGVYCMVAMHFKQDTLLYGRTKTD